MLQNARRESEKEVQETDVGQEEFREEGSGLIKANSLMNACRNAKISKQNEDRGGDGESTQIFMGNTALKTADFTFE